LKDGLSPAQTGGGPIDLASWAKGASLGQENATTVKGDQTAKMDSTEKPAEFFSSMTRSVTETENTFNSKASGSLKGAESFSGTLLSERHEKTGTVKQDTDMRATVTIEPVRESNGSQKMSTQGPVNDSEIEIPVKDGKYNRSTLHSQSPISTDGRGPSGGQQRQETSLTNDHSPVSKLVNDTPVEKDNPIKIDIVSGNDTGSKVFKLEAGTNDGGQLGPQTQPSEKAHETAFAPKETEAGPREFRTQTMEQIVRRAVVQVRDGQHEARIDLKPDFMGHVRMQVITENQQVTVKILTEFGFVKDMIENNIQQLKADLQQQGLDVDKLDVSVSRDSNNNKHQQENAAHARSFSPRDKSSDRGNDGEEQPEHKQRSMARAEGSPTVDYFA
jgi:flagellar hook-length control protein FliK